MELTKRNLTAGDGMQEDVVKVKLWDKPRALEMLAKHFALLTEVVDMRLDADLRARLDRGRQRNAQRNP